MLTSSILGEPRRAYVCGLREYDCASDPTKALTQGIGVITGQQQHFEWSQVAFAGVTAGVAQGLAGAENLQGQAPGWGKSLEIGANLVVGGAVAKVLTGGKETYADVAADAFGSVLGDSLVPQPEQTYGPTFADDHAARMAMTYQNGGIGMDSAGTQFAPPSEFDPSSIATSAATPLTADQRAFYNAAVAGPGGGIASYAPTRSSAVSGNSLGLSDQQIYNNGQAIVNQTLPGVFSDIVNNMPPIQIGITPSDTNSFPTVNSLQSAANQQLSNADLLNKSSEWAFSQGNSDAGIAYRQAAITAATASSIYSTSALNLTVSLQSTVPVAITPSQFADGWNTGEYSAGLPASGRARPDYYTIGGGSLSGVGSVAVNGYDGSTYLSGGVAQSNISAVSFKPSLTGTVGWIIGANDAASTNNFLVGDSNQTFISIPTPWNINAFGAVTHSYGGGYALELGIASPGKLSYGVTPWSHSTQLINGTTK